MRKTESLASDGQWDVHHDRGAALWGLGRLPDHVASVGWGTEGRLIANSRVTAAPTSGAVARDEGGEVAGSVQGEPALLRRLGFIEHRELLTNF